MTDERRIDRMAGCAHLGKGMLSLGIVAVAVLCFLNLNRCFFITDRGSNYLRVRQTVKDLKIVLELYKLDYNRFPLPATSTTDLDVSLRSRGPMLQALCGGDVGGLNPKKIRYMEPQMARNHKNGLWQDGEEWVLSDLWGEPYYIILDTNNDGRVANPEGGSENQPAMLQAEVLTYSSGPDRDPKTWEDNVCSWRSR